MQYFLTMRFETKEFWVTAPSPLNSPIITDVGERDRDRQTETGHNPYHDDRIKPWQQTLNSANLTSSPEGRTNQSQVIVCEPFLLLLE